MIAMSQNQKFVCTFLNTKIISSKGDTQTTSEFMPLGLQALYQCNLIFYNMMDGTKTLHKIIQNLILKNIDIFTKV
jgi:hypothetical protein